MILTGFNPQAAQAASFDQLMNEHKTANVQVLQQKEQQTNQALDLSKNVASLETKSAKLDTQINQTTQKVSDLKATIAQTEKDLTKQRGQMVVNVGKSSDQNKVNDTTDKMNKLTAQLTSAKQSIVNMKADKSATEANLSNTRAESERLLGLNQDERSKFEASVKDNFAKMNQPQQNKTANNNTQNTATPETPVTPTAPAPAPAPAPDPAAIAAASQSYPWLDVPFPSDGVDPWGMFYRQCVSYTAWKVAHSGRHMPTNWGGHGNANQWADNARADGIPVDTTPRVGDVAVWYIGQYGHVMYVEGVNGDGTINVSQMNYDLQGHYSEMTIGTGGMEFIHFP